MKFSPGREPYCTDDVYLILCILQGKFFMVQLFYKLCHSSIVVGCKILHLHINYAYAVNQNIENNMGHTVTSTITSVELQLLLHTLMLNICKLQAFGQT